MVRVQIIAIVTSLMFLAVVARLIVRGHLREEYALMWVGATSVLVLFSFWRGGLDVMSHLMGVYEPPNLVFTGAIFGILAYLLHLSVVVSRLQAQNKRLAQELALLQAQRGPRP
jgi:hypothetical protein